MRMKQDRSNEARKARHSRARRNLDIARRNLLVANYDVACRVRAAEVTHRERILEKITAEMTLPFL